MYATFSPDGMQVAYVRAGNLYVEDLNTGAIRALTTDGSETLINAAGDWVYEEELNLRQAFRWSPDGRSHSLLAVRRKRGRAVHDHQQHRLALSEAHYFSLPEGRHEEPGGPYRHCGCNRRKAGMGFVAGRCP